MSTEGVDAATVVSAVLDGPDPGPGKPSASGLVTSAMYARSTGRGQPIPEEEWAGCWDRSIIAALLAVNPGGSVLLSPDGKLSTWEPPTLTDEERTAFDLLGELLAVIRDLDRVAEVTETIEEAGSEWVSRYSMPVGPLHKALGLAGRIATWRSAYLDRLAPPPVQQEEA